MAVPLRSTVIKFRLYVILNAVKDLLKLAQCHFQRSLVALGMTDASDKLWDLGR
jgi:hypothetical protein